MSSFIHFKIGKQSYLLNTNDTQYILNASDVKFFSVNNDYEKGYLRGLFIGRDNNTTLAISLSSLCGIYTNEKDAQFLIVFSDKYAILVDQVCDVFTVNEKLFEDSPIKSKFIKRIYKGVDGLILELSIDNIVHELNGLILTEVTE